MTISCQPDGSPPQGFVYSADADATVDAEADGGRGRGFLCIRRTLSRHVTISTLTVIFAVFTVFWLFLVLGRHVTIGTPMVIFSLSCLSFHCFWLFLTVFDHWYTADTVLVDVTIGTPMVILLFLLYFDSFWLFLTIGTLLVHYWYSLGRSVTIGKVMVKNSQKTVITAKMTLVYQSSHVYKVCTNSVATVYQSSTRT